MIYLPFLWIDNHHRARWQQAFELIDVVVVHRDAAGGPVYIAAVQLRFVGAVNSDSAADIHRAAVFDRHFATAAELFVAMAIDRRIASTPRARTAGSAALSGF